MKLIAPLPSVPHWPRVQYRLIPPHRVRCHDAALLAHEQASEAVAILSHVIRHCADMKHQLSAHWAIRIWIEGDRRAADIPLHSRRKFRVIVRIHELVVVWQQLQIASVSSLVADSL